MTFFITVFCGFTGYSQQHDEFIVVLDAGHGGKDPGKIGYQGAKEKDVALNIVLNTGKILEAIPNVKVIYTRKSDVFVDLWERGKIANRADADLFVSVHCNAHTSQAKGSETWVLGVHANKRNFEVAKAENEVILLEENYEQKYKGFNPKSPTSVIGLSLEQEENLDQSLLLASLIQETFEKSLKRVNRGVKQAGFVVLYQTYMPSVLIETGFLTNRIEGKYLYSKEGQRQMSVAISGSVKKYLDQTNANVAQVLDVLIDEEPKEKIVKTPNVIAPKQLNESFEEHTAGKSGPCYTIQIAASKNEILLKPENFKGLHNVKSFRVDGLYKYHYETFSDRNEAYDALDYVKSKGYTSAFMRDCIKLKRTVNSPKVAEKNNPIHYKVQVASSVNKIGSKSSNFKGLQGINRVQVGKYYKYYLGDTTSYNEAKRNLLKAQSKKYTSAFIAAFKGVERISLKEALKN